MIVCFSGTGNTAAVASLLREKIGGDIVWLSGRLLREPSSARLELPAGEPVVWCFPIHAWAPPKVVETFMEKVRIKGCGELTPHFLVCTCGDDVGIAHRRWARIIGRRGWFPRAAWSVAMPNTYVCLSGFDVDAPEVAKAKMEAMPARVEKIAQRILSGHCGEEADVVAGDWAWAKTEILRPLFRGFLMSPKPFVCHADKCISCGVCARECPTQNIAMHNGAPTWGDNCTACLRCLHGCPTRAIDYGSQTAGKGRYRPLPVKRT